MTLQVVQTMPPPAGATAMRAPTYHGLTAVAIGCRPLRGLPAGELREEEERGKEMWVKSRARPWVDGPVHEEP